MSTMRPMKQNKNNEFFLRETHGIHVGTENDPVKHGIDDIDAVTKKAIAAGHPSIAFIIHTPRLTSFRYPAERESNIKFIRGDTAYFNYAAKMERLREQYGKQIEIRYGIELEWMGPGLGLQWSRSKLFQAREVDYVIGSVHFSREGVPYDDSKRLTNRLIKERQGLDNFWMGYLDEMIEMVDGFGSMINVVGHLDLPKIFAPVPGVLQDIRKSDHPLTKRLFTLLEMIRDHNLAIDINLAGIHKGCGIYPSQSILKITNSLGIPITLGTDTHRIEDLGKNFNEGIKYALKAGYNSYISFSAGIPKKWPLKNNIKKEHFDLLNLGTRIINQRFDKKAHHDIPLFSFGGKYQTLAETFPHSNTMGKFEAIRVRKEGRSITLGERAGNILAKKTDYLYFHHTNRPGTLSLLFSILASEGINVETAYLYQCDDGTGEAFITVDVGPEQLKPSIEFALGTDPTRFIKLEPKKVVSLPSMSNDRPCLLEIDGVDINIPISNTMLISIHNDHPGVLFTLLAALASRNINVIDLKLGKRGDRGFAALGIEGEAVALNALSSKILGQLGPQFHEISLIW